MRIYEIIEKSLNLKIYISSYNYDFWEESEDNQNNNNKYDPIKSASYASTEIIPSEMYRNSFFYRFLYT